MTEKYAKQLEIEKLNKIIIDNIINSVPVEDFIDFYLYHNQKETLEHFGLRTTKQLTKILKLFNYDFSKPKPSKFKGKTAARSHESYLAGGQKSANTQKENWQNKSEKEKEAWSKKQTEAHSSDDFKQKIKQININYQANLTAEQKAEKALKKSIANKATWSQNKKEILEKAYDTKKANKSFNCSKPEDAKNAYYINNIEKYLNLTLETNFPYDNFTDAELTKDYKSFKKSNNKSSNSGLRIVRQFHPSIWRCNRYGYKSPVDAWNDPEIMYKVIENRLKYLKEDLSVYNIRAGLSISKKAPKVSVFKPATAKYLIEKYLNEYAEIFDPCCGFSGRMLGACILDKRYIGQDINSVTIKESNKIKDYFKLNADLKVNDSIYASGKYECLFTCPPYGNKENWHQDIEVLSADEWIDVCLKNYKCKAYLFVVDKTEKYKDFVVEEFKNKSYLNENSEQVVFIKNNQII